MRIRTVLLTAAMAAGTLFAGVGPAAAAQPAPAAALGGIGTYNLTVRTGDLLNADTEDAVRFAVQGTESWAPSFRIDRDFRRGETVTFGAYRWPSVGTVTSVTVQKSAQERDAWYVEYVQVHDEHTGRVYHCEIGEWIQQRDSKQHKYTCV
jgi:hypothetical protein